jgi:DNA-binding transcriptional LysR family regulator
VDRLEAMTMLLMAVEKGSLSAAARDLQIPVPTLTRKVGELEAQLGTRLLTRTTRKLTLTDAGLAYVSAARHILALVKEQEREATGEFITPRGDLVVTSPVTLGRTHVVPEIIDFLAEFPDINIKLMQSDRNVNLVDAHVDLAVRIGHLPDSGMIATRVGSMRIVMCASPAFLESHPAPAHPDALADLPTIVFNGPMLSPGWRFRLPDTGDFTTIAVNPRLLVSAPDAAAHAAIRGVGITQLLHYHIADAVEAGTLRIIMTEYECEPVPIHLVHVSRNLMPLKLRRFIDFAVPRLRASLAKYSTPMAGDKRSAA